MRVQFFIENTWYGKGSSNIKGKNTPILDVELPSLPQGNIKIDEVWFTSKYIPSWIFSGGGLLRVEVIIRPLSGDELMAWNLDRAPYTSENRGSTTNTIGNPL